MTIPKVIYARVPYENELHEVDDQIIERYKRRFTENSAKEVIRKYYTRSRLERCVLNALGLGFLKWHAALEFLREKRGHEYVNALIEGRHFNNKFIFH